MGLCYRYVCLIDIFACNSLEYSIGGGAVPCSGFGWFALSAYWNSVAEDQVYYVLESAFQAILF